jgi:hypothetical protein
MPGSPSISVTPVPVAMSSSARHPAASSASRPTIVSVLGMDIAVNPGRCVTLAVTAGRVKADRVFWPCAVLR